MTAMITWGMLTNNGMMVGSAQAVLTFSVIPAKAGIQSRAHIYSLWGIDSRFRGNDDLSLDDEENIENVNTT